MKKFIVFLCIIGFPLNVFAYSDRVYLGGNTVGINIKSEGIMVIGFYNINGSKPKTSLKEGDIIVKVGNTKVNTTSELTKAIEDNLEDNKVNITYKRGKKEDTTDIILENVGGIYKTGLYVKDSITGIGTVSFIDGDTYGCLGHEVIESNTSKMIEVKSGSIFENSISSIEMSKDGSPGSKNAKFYYQNTYGDITKNTKYGIYGSWYSNVDEKRLIDVGKPSQVELGDATIYTVLNGEDIEEFTIKITKINLNSDIKNITFEITDERLLKETGGIVQGMSGSPIVQNGKLIGAVTHVVTDNVKTGYGIFITTMLEESDKD